MFVKQIIFNDFGNSKIFFDDMKFLKVLHNFRLVQKICKIKYLKKKLKRAVFKSRRQILKIKAIKIRIRDSTLNLLHLIQAQKLFDNQLDLNVQNQTIVARRFRR